MSNKSKQNNQSSKDGANDDKKLMMNEIMHSQSMTSHLRSALAIAISVLLFIGGCSLLFEVISVILPVIKLMIGFTMAYVLLLNPHFAQFRESFFDSHVGPVTLWNDFCAGISELIASFLGKDWMSRVCSHWKK